MSSDSVTDAVTPLASDSLEEPPNADAVVRPDVDETFRAWWRIDRDARLKERFISDGAFATPTEADEAAAAYLAAHGRFAVPEGTPAERALARCYAAYETKDACAMTRLAREALEFDPQCAEAYEIIATLGTGNPDKTAELYAKAVEAADRRLDAATRERWRENYLGHQDTRIVYRCKIHLALFREGKGEYSEALKLMRECRRHEASDPGNLAGMMLPHLLVEGYEIQALEEAMTLIASAGERRRADVEGELFEDALLTALLARAVGLFKIEGGSPSAEAAVKEVARANPYLPFALVQIVNPEKRRDEEIRKRDPRACDAARRLLRRFTPVFMADLPLLRWLGGKLNECAEETFVASSRRTADVDRRRGRKRGDGVEIV